MLVQNGTIITTFALDVNILNKKRRVSKFDCELSGHKLPGAALLIPAVEVFEAPRDVFKKKVRDVHAVLHFRKVEEILGPFILCCELQSAVYLVSSLYVEGVWSIAVSA